MSATMYENFHQHSFSFDNNVMYAPPEMINNNYNMPFQQANVDVNNFYPGPVALCSGPDENMCNFRDPALASSPPVVDPSMDQPLCPSDEACLQSVVTQLVKTTLKQKIKSRYQHLPQMDPHLPAKEEASWLATSCCGNSFSASDDSSFAVNALTPEDEERRRRRRERNKIAATKCRNKKKEKTQILVKEAEDLEKINTELKRDAKMLREQLRELTTTLECHQCVKQQNEVIRNNYYKETQMNYNNYPSENYWSIYGLMPTESPSSGE